ncbi:hypothetical protein ACJJTC_000459 [Scirpophaga incertulas]
MGWLRNTYIQKSDRDSAKNCYIHSVVSLGEEFRELASLTTKCVTAVMQMAVEQRGLLSENQLETVRMIQGAKEQAMINIAINKASANDLITTLIDVNKVFDFADYSYLNESIKQLNPPFWIYPFLTSSVSK